MERNIVQCKVLKARYGEGINKWGSANVIHSVNSTWWKDLGSIENYTPFAVEWFENGLKRKLEMEGTLFFDRNLGWKYFCVCCLRETTISQKIKMPQLRKWGNGVKEFGNGN